MNFTPNFKPDGTICDWLNKHAELSPDKICYQFSNGDSDLTWSALFDKVNKIAKYLVKLNINKGDSIAICMSNGRPALQIFYAILYGGFRVTPLNLAAGPAALGHAISHSKCKHIFVDDPQLETLNNALLETDTNPKIINVSNSLIEETDPSIKLHDISPSDHALLMYTSGTTGVPKGVIHTHSSLLAGGWTTAVAHNLQSSDRALCVLPLYHINGLCVTVIAPLISGGSSVICPKFSNSNFWTDCEKFKITWFSVVPTIISHLLHGKNDPSEITKKRLRFGRSASAPLAVDTQSSFEKRFGVPIIETMGLTETAAQILSNPLPPGQRKIGSPGIAFGNKVKIVLPNGDDQINNTIGEIAVKGPNVMLEYLDNYEASQKTFTNDGWLLTGDLGYIDNDGYVFVSGRLKELIIKGGENISPREIDDALYAHKDVIEAAAFAIPCDIYGQRIEAAVKLTKNSKAIEAEFLNLCYSKLGKFKAPDKIHFMDELPKGPSGKIQRIKLLDVTDGLNKNKVY
ncbi:AMP-binding protein [Amylibacter sp.]|nr:AMP-binding protein [Amylibacter sp.]MDB4146231.1 AMP-binding protein [Amylibacter sp.]MDB4190089.1 AMP-binding protein [Amylibacter sp.]MDB4248721.1 AMP-binding protein [Amylibacter sp.]MDB9729677.1 AMP-binding protein [Amylibacter sp.]|tara:strand:- start:2062 stop:3609 length:1548 start_codon:yes stop_codon:yes gene_type:complete